MESLFGELEDLSSQTGITVEMGHNFLSDHWIAFTILQQFSKPVFIEVPLESLLGEEKVLARKNQNNI